MQIDFTKTMQNIDGNDFVNEGKKVTLKDITINSLLGVYDDERALDPQIKFRRGLLAQRIYANSKEIDLTVEEIAEVKKLIGKNYGPLFVVQAWQILEGR